ncbi:anti-sigma factor family protein [Plebeiibacterium marinum]|uniref:Zinc-finger domain-containing protein n=1 Tax=Plebeiibacterium marinum TaxID=2992111 RepID=A0AAE3MG03_9BACT|nr:hypothetical protein [Plebeiobacterium marinum]MCW3807026.1 hypothetical protein [Plebeiobacterium marinum]
MKITIDNYEEWMVDFLDGTLSEEDQKQFEQFLDENPHVKDEMDGLDELVLTPEPAFYDDKSSLIKTEAEFFEIPYQDYIAIKELEIGLTPKEQKWKKDLCQSHTESKTLFKTYQRTIIHSDKNILYSHKNDLKRASILPFVSISTFRKMSAAAAIALLLGIGGIPILKQSGNQLQTVVVNDTPSLIEIPKKEQQKSKEVSLEKDILSTQNANNKKIEVYKREEASEKSTVKLLKDSVKPMIAKGIDNRFYNKTLNAYEIGLNSMMPIVISNNLRQTEEDLIALENHVSLESQKLSRSAKVVNSGIKFINYLSGNPTTVKKYLNENGEMVAYQLESDNISLSRKIKSLPVTN